MLVFSGVTNITLAPGPLDVKLIFPKFLLENNIKTEKSSIRVVKMRL